MFRNWLQFSESVFRDAYSLSWRALGCSVLRQMGRSFKSTRRSPETFSSEDEITVILSWLDLSAVILFCNLSIFSLRELIASLDSSRSSFIQETIFAKLLTSPVAIFSSSKLALFVVFRIFNISSACSQHVQNYCPVHARNGDMASR